MNKIFFLLISILLMAITVNAKVAVQSFNSQIQDAESIVIGTFKEDKSGQIVFIVEDYMKGESKQKNEIVITKDSKLAWRMLKGEGPVAPANDEEFIQQIKQAEWFNKKVILAGKNIDGKWISFCYDWSVWTSGKSTREDAYKDMSLDELVEAIGVKLAPEKAKE